MATEDPEEEDGFQCQVLTAEGSAVITAVSVSAEERLGEMLAAVDSSSCSGMGTLCWLLRCVGDTSALLPESGTSHSLTEVTPVRAAAAQRVGSIWDEALVSGKQESLAAAKQTLLDLLHCGLPEVVMESLTQSVMSILEQKNTPGFQDEFMETTLAGAADPEKEDLCMTSLGLLSHCVQRQWTQFYQENIITCCQMALKHGSTSVQRSALSTAAETARVISPGDTAEKIFVTCLIPLLIPLLENEAADKEVLILTLWVIERSVRSDLLGEFSDYSMQLASSIATAKHHRGDCWVEVRIAAIRVLSAFPVAELCVNNMLQKLWDVHLHNGTSAHAMELKLAQAALDGLTSIASQTDALGLVLEAFEARAWSLQTAELLLLPAIEHLCVQPFESQDPRQHPLCSSDFTLVLKLLEHHRQQVGGDDWVYTLNAVVPHVDLDAFAPAFINAAPLMCASLALESTFDIGFRIVNSVVPSLNSAVDTAALGGVVASLDASMYQYGGPAVIAAATALSALCKSCTTACAPLMKAPLATMTKALHGTHELARKSLPTEQAIDEREAISECILAMVAVLPRAGTLLLELKMTAVDGAAALLALSKQHQTQTRLNSRERAFLALSSVTKVAVGEEESGKAVVNEITKRLRPLILETLPKALLATKEDDLREAQAAIAFIGQAARVEPDEFPSTEVLDRLCDMLKHRTGLTEQFHEEVARALGYVLLSSLASTQQAMYANLPVRSVATTVDLLASTATQCRNRNAQAAALHAIALVLPFVDTTTCTVDSGATITQARTMDVSMSQALFAATEVLSQAAHHGDALVCEATRVACRFAASNPATYIRTFLPSHSQATVDIMRASSPPMIQVAVFNTWAHLSQTLSGPTVAKLNEEHLGCLLDAVHRGLEAPAKAAACRCLPVLAVLSGFDPERLMSSVVPMLVSLLQEPPPENDLHASAIFAAAKLGVLPGVPLEDIVQCFLSDRFEFRQPGPELDAVFTMLTKLMTERHPVIAGVAGRIPQLVMLVGSLVVESDEEPREMAILLVTALYGLEEESRGLPAVVEEAELAAMVKTLPSKQRLLLASLRSQGI